VSKEKALKFIKYYEKLKTDRANWDNHWREIAEYVMPNKDNIYGGNTAGQKKAAELYDTTGVHSNTLLGAALHGMLTNPSLPWFGLTTGFDEIDSDDDVRKWLQDCTRIMLNVMNNSNFQTEIHEVYLDLGSFGTGALLIVEDDVDVVRFLSIPIYEMYIDENFKGAVNTVARCFKKPVKDILEEYGEKVFEENNLMGIMKDPHKEFEILHVIGENSQYNPHEEKLGNYKFYSETILKDKKIVLKSKGFNTWPMPIPRWNKISGEKYGRSPAMNSLPDNKMINQMMKTTLRAAQKMIDPPLQAPDEGMMGPLKTTPGSINWYRAGTTDRVEPILTGGRVDFGFQMMDDVRKRIRASFFIDQLQMPQGPQMTATEVMQRTEEQLRLLGPILGRQHNELLKPLVDRVFDICLRRGLFKKVPAKLANLKKIDVQYSSQIAQAQKLAALESFNRMMGMTAPLFQMDPNTMDNLDTDQAFHYIAKTVGLPYELIRRKNDVKKLRDAKSQQAQDMMDQQNQQHEADIASKTAPVLEMANAK
jgi:hypothetical protein